MAHFYGTLKGARGEASRLGHKQSGIESRTASWQGSVACHAWHDAENDIDMVRVSLSPWHGQGADVTLYLGPISGDGCPPNYAELARIGQGIAKLNQRAV